MTIQEVISAFINDARYRIAQIAILLDSSSSSLNNKKNRALADCQMQLIVFLDCLYVDRFSFYDLKYNFLDWTDEEITRETEYLRYYCSVEPSPVTPIVPFSPFIFSPPSSILSGGGHIIEDEGNPLTQRSKLNFVGDGVTALDDFVNRTTKVVISGGSVFAGNVTFVLAAGKSFGKYVNGQTALWAGLTAMQAMLDAAIEYLSPVFSAFSITGQATTVEVGTTLSGSKTFTWAIMVNSGIVSTIDLYDNTAVAILLAGTANDGSQAQVITTIQLNANGSTQSWKAIGHDSGLVPGDFNSSNFVVTSRFFRWWDAVAASLTDSASVRALAHSAFQTGAGAFNLDTGTTLIKFVVALPPGVTIVSVIDLDALNADLTAQYVAQASINVLDAGGGNRVYNIYEMSIGIPYSVSHRHQITTT